MDDLKDNVFGNVAILTFHAEFLPAVTGEDHQVWSSTTKFSVRHNLGTIKLEAGKYADTLKTFEEDLKEFPKNG